MKYHNRDLRFTVHDRPWCLLHGRRQIEPGRPVVSRHPTPFTLLELLIVLVIVSAVLTLIAPRVGKLPSRVTIGSATTQLKSAFADAGMRARTTGHPVTLLLSRERNSIILQDGTLPLDNSATNSTLDIFDADRQQRDGQDTSTLRYDLDDAIDWTDGGVAFSQTEVESFVFLPDGDASGPVLRFEIRGRPFKLFVSRLTGQVHVVETTP